MASCQAVVPGGPIPVFFRDEGPGSRDRSSRRGFHVEICIRHVYLVHSQVTGFPPVPLKHCLNLDRKHRDAQLLILRSGSRRMRPRPPPLPTYWNRFFLCNNREKRFTISIICVDSTLPRAPNSFKNLSIANRAVSPVFVAVFSPGFHGTFIMLLRCRMRSLRGNAFVNPSATSSSEATSMASRR